MYRLPACYLVDLPGYGFARASKTARAGYRKIIEGYLRQRENIAGIVWLLDIRHSPSREDRWMQELLTKSGHPVLVVLTKADKLGRQARHRRLTDLAGDLQLPEDQVQLVSSTTGDGIAELGESLAAATTGGGA